MTETARQELNRLRTEQESPRQELNRLRTADVMPELWDETTPAPEPWQGSSLTADFAKGTAEDVVVRLLPQPFPSESHNIPSPLGSG